MWAWEEEINFYVLSLYTFFWIYLLQKLILALYTLSFSYVNVTIFSYQLFADHFLFLVAHYLESSSA